MKGGVENWDHHGHLGMRHVDGAGLILLFWWKFTSLLEKISTTNLQRSRDEWS